MWPGIRIVEQNPYEFFPFNPRWRERFNGSDFEVFCALLRTAWISPRPCFLPADRDELMQLLAGQLRMPLTERVMSQFERHQQTGLLFFPPQLRALRRLVNGEDLYSLLWDERL